VSDQFGPKRQIEQALMKHGKRISLEQRPRAESDPAVAAASILARAAFVHALLRMGKKYGIEIPKGASDAVRAAAEQLVERDGPSVLLETAKCHFKTADHVLEAVSLDRSALGPEGAVVSRARKATS
jgi:ribonuclease HIII